MIYENFKEFCSKMIGFQVIGASPEECYGEGIPVNSGNNSEGLGDEKSWWERRHEKFEEMLEEQIKEAREREKPRRYQGKWD